MSAYGSDFNSGSVVTKKMAVSEERCFRISKTLEVTGTGTAATLNAVNAANEYPLFDIKWTAGATTAPQSLALSLPENGLPVFQLYAEEAIPTAGNRFVIAVYKGAVTNNVRVWNISLFNSLGTTGNVTGGSVSQLTVRFIKYLT